MKYYNLIVKSSCLFCQEALLLLKMRGEQHVYTDMENCEKSLELAQEESGHKTVPIIWEAFLREDSQIELRFIGGCDDLKKHLEGQDKIEATISQ